MSPTELIVAAGQATFGGQWKAGLARSLGVSVRSIDRWLSGRVVPRPGVFVDLLKAMQARRGEIDGVIEAVEAYLASKAPGDR